MIDDAGVSAIAVAVEKNTKLTTLDLSCERGQASRRGSSEFCGHARAIGAA